MGDIEQHEGIKGQHNPRPVMDSSLANALAGLVETLRAVFGASGASDARKQRERHTAALIALAEFLDRLDADTGDAGGKLAELGHALADLNQGTVHPLLKKTAFANRAPDRSDVWDARADAAVGIAFLARSGKSPSEAAAMAANDFPALSRLLRPGASLETSILNWYAELRPDAEGFAKAGNPRAAAAFKLGAEIADILVDQQQLDRCYRTGLALLRRAEIKAERLIIELRSNPHG